MKGLVILKLKRIGSVLFTITLVLVFILFYLDSKSSTDLKKNQSVPLPTELNPVVKERSDQLIQQAAKKGIEVVITDGFRSATDQDKLYQQGRSTGGNIVTNAQGGESYHNFGLAIDFALETPSGDVLWDREYDRNENGVADWTEVVQMAKALGFDWGGDWKGFKDYPHLEMNFGLTIADLQNGERPSGTSLTADVDKD